MAVDTVLADAVDFARAEAQTAAGDAGAVGDYLGAVAVDDRLLTHRFATNLPGYRGWVWEVTLSRAPRARVATMCEAHLVPLDDALLAPAWLPWADRVKPGDLEASMVLPLVKDDPRVVPGYTVTDDGDAEAVANWELGLGRERVLGPEGREQAAERWVAGVRGPSAPSANASSAPCSACAFFLPMAGSFRLEFGVCANEWSPADGSVVAANHGCGAHSQTDVERSGFVWPQMQPVYDSGLRDDFVIHQEPAVEPVEIPVSQALVETPASADAEDTEVAQAVPEPASPTEDAAEHDSDAQPLS